MLTTRCPGCATAFRTTPGQLSARGGKARCGNCATVFDGIAGLLEEQPGTEQTGAGPSPQPALLGAGLPRANNALIPEFLQEDLPPPRRLLWGFCALLALAALALQASLVYRTQIALLLPVAREPLAAACEQLGCELQLPRRPELMAIESSELQTDTRRENVILLNAVIRNRASFTQEYPALELTLTDERDQAVVRRVLAPADYLSVARAARLAQGLAPGSDAVLRVDFDSSRIHAVGYRLYLFFP